MYINREHFRLFWFFTKSLTDYKMFVLEIQVCSTLKVRNTETVERHK